MSDHESRRRDAMQKTARDLREQSARSGVQMTQTQAESRVRAAVTTCDNKRNK